MNKFQVLSSTYTKGSVTERTISKQQSSVTLTSSRTNPNTKTKHTYYSKFINKTQTNDDEVQEKAQKNRKVSRRILEDETKKVNNIILSEIKKELKK